jgi:hypothetical protein
VAATLVPRCDPGLLFGKAMIDTRGLACPGAPFQRRCRDLHLPPCRVVGELNGDHERLSPEHTGSTNAGDRRATRFPVREAVFLRQR